MLSRLRVRVGNPSTADVPDATLTIALNEAFESIWDRYRFHANRGLDTSIVTVAGTNSYALPATVDVVMNVRDATNKVRLGKGDRNWWSNLDQGSTTSKPTMYYTEFGTLYLDPVPDDAYTLNITHRKSYTALSSGSDIPTIPTSWHLGGVLLARYCYWESLGNWQFAQAADAVWKNWVSDKTIEIDEELFADAEFGLQPYQLGATDPGQDFDHED